MDILKIAALGVITAFTVLILRENKSETAVLAGIAGGVLILLSVIDYFIDITAMINAIVDKSGIPSSLMLIILKIVGIGYITDFAAGIVEESGQKPLADKIVLAGKLIIMGVALPIVAMLFETVTELMP